MRRNSIPRLYADTSVFGGVFDEEFAGPSQTFFDQVRQGGFHLVISDVVRREMEGAPEAVRFLLDEILAFAEIAPVTADALTLRQAYLDAQALSRQLTAGADGSEGVRAFLEGRAAAYRDA